MIVAPRENYHRNQMRLEGRGVPSANKCMVRSMKEIPCLSDLILLALDSILPWRIVASGKVEVMRTDRATAIEVIAQAGRQQDIGRSVSRKMMPEMQARRRIVFRMD